MRQIVLADDSKTIQKVIKLSFSDDEYEVLCFENGTTVLEHVRRRGGNIVLVDVDLPLLDGYELCRVLKEDPRTASIPVVLLAGTFEPLDEDRAARVRSDGVLTKPFDISELVELINRLVSRQRKVEELGRSYLGQLGQVTKGSFFYPPVPTVSGDPVFRLTPEQCAPSAEVLSREMVRIVSPPIAVSSLSEDQFEALVNEVSKLLPETLRELVPDLVKKMPGS